MGMREWMRQRLIASLICVFWLVCCGRPSEEEPPPQPESTSPQPANAENEGTPEVVEARFDDEGRLLPSDEFVAGVRLPKGLSLYRRTEREHIYRTELPIKKVLAYFGPMLMTGKVDRMGEGAVYRRASVLGAEMNPTKVDVSILKAGDLTRVAITELPPPSKFAPSAQETRRKVQKSWRMLD